MRPAIRVDELEALVRTRVCAVCTGRNAEGACTLNPPESCALFDLFPLVAQAILATESDRVEDYMQAIQENVCSVCLDQGIDGVCPRRTGVQCALNTHMVQIVEAIEEATGRSLDRKVVSKP